LTPDIQQRDIAFRAFRRPEVTEVEAEGRSSRRLAFLPRIPHLGLIVVLLALTAIFTARSPGFVSAFNLNAMGRSLAVDIVVGFSQMVVLAIGGMNLSVGAIGVCTVMFAGYAMQIFGLPVWVAFPLAIVLGAALGAVNGIAIVRSGVNAFIVTLATASIYFGAMLVITKAQPYNALPREVGLLGQLRIFGFISPALVVAVVTGAALAIFYRYAVGGREALAVGANPRAADMSGIRVNRVVVQAHALSGVLAAIAGLMVLVRAGAAMPAAAGDDWLLPSFLGPVIGGVALAGGAVSVLGTALGAALVTIIRSGLLVLDIGSFWLQLFLGLFLLGAVILQRSGDLRRWRLR
jgi:ribose transport system permease protein